MVAADELRGFLARLLGWERDRAVDDALRSVKLAAAYRAQLVLFGAGDLVPIAYALHRRTLGADRPFIVCDPHRRNTPASLRAPANQESGVAAFEAAAVGSLCVRVRGRSLPHDFSSLVALLRGTDDVLLVVCTDRRDDAHPLLVRPSPILLPALSERASELPQIVDEYALDAIAELGAPSDSFTDDDRAWTLEHAAESLAEIEKATLRLVALHVSRNMSDAAARLGMAPVSLSRWIGRRDLPPIGGKRDGHADQ